MTLTLQTPKPEEDADTGAVAGLDAPFALNLRIPEDPTQRERMAVVLYDLRAVSQGNAARIAGLSRAGFIDALGRHGVTPFQYDDAGELRADLKTLADARASPERKSGEAQASSSPNGSQAAQQ